MAKERRVTFSTRRFLIGRAGPFPRLVFREDVMLHLDQFSHLHTHGEHGGFLLGKKRELKSAECYEVLVERFVPVAQTEDAARLVLTEAHLQTVQRALHQSEEEATIVGWAHTHPGFGVFLSNFDKEQHLRFFPEPWHIAYVMDNQANQRAAYHVVDGEWHCLEGYYILKEMAHNEIVLTAGRPKKRRLPVVPLFILLLLLIGAAGLGYGWLRRHAALSVQAPPSTSLPAQTGERPAGAADHKLASEQAKDSNKAVADTVLPQERETRSAEYIVQRDDNLWKIADKLWGDPHLFPLIAEMNDLQDPGFLPVGKVLLIPERPRDVK